MADQTFPQRIQFESTSNNSTAYVMVIFSLAMLIIPVFSYFFSRAAIFEALFKMSNTDSYFYAAIVAVIVVHVLLAVFVYVAFKVDSRPGAMTYKRD